MQEPQFDDLYREMILDHYRRPRNRGGLETATQRVDGMNPVCGDEIHLDMTIHGGVVEAVMFSGQGCSISQSSASMLTEQVRGRTMDEVRHMIAGVRAMLMDGAAPASDIGDLEALEGVAKLPVRVKCALLSWNVLQEGLNQASTAA